MIKRVRWLLSMSLWMVFLQCSLCPLLAIRAEADNGIRVVRVGFFPMRGFHHYDRLGKPAGYEVDYLERIAIYARWEIRYVPVNSWTESLAALERGELDLMGATLMDPSRLPRFEYSAQPSGSTREVMVSGAESPLVYEDFKAFDRLRVGCLRTSLRQQVFADYAANKNFHPEIVYFDTVRQMRQAMTNGDIDTMLVTVLEVLAGERILAEFSPAPFYTIAGKGATELMLEFNEAMTEIKEAELDFEDRLMARWYPQTHVFPFSREELDYIQQRGQLTMSLLADRAPFSKLNEETGVFEGIVPDVLRIISRESGLDFVLSPMPEEIPPADALEIGQIMAAAGLVRYEEQLRDRRLVLTDSFYTSTCVMLGRKGESFNVALPLNIALPPGFRAVKDFITANYPHFRQVPILRLHNALSAVREGHLDGFMQNSHLLQPHLQGPQYANLAVVPEVNFAEPLAIALPAHADPLLLSILNKSIRRLDPAEVRQIAINHVLSEPYVMTLDDILLHYSLPIKVIAALSVLCILLLICCVRSWRKNMQLIRDNEETLKNITNNINGGVITLNPESGFSITYANMGFLELLGYGEDAYSQAIEADCMAFIHSDDVRLFHTALKARESTGGQVAVDVRMRHRNGMFVPVLLRGTVGQDKHGCEVLFCVIVDITEQKAMIRSLEVETERYRLLLEQSTDMVFEYDAAARFVSCSARFRVAFGITARVGDIFQLAFHPGDELLMETMLEEIGRGKPHTASRVRLRHPNGVYSWCRLVLSGIMNNGSLQRVLGRIEDVDADVLEQQRLEALIRRDSLCGLINRTAFRSTVDSVLRGAGVEREGTLFLVDVENFKALSEQLGPEVGDQILQETATSLRRLFRDYDLLSRHDSNQFCIYAKDMTFDRATRRVESIQTTLQREYRSKNGEVVTSTVRVGVARNPADGLTCDALLDKAEVALRSKGEV